MGRDILSNKLREKLLAGECALGTWVCYTDPSSAEVLAQAGFDWLLIDVEHSHIGPEALRNIIIAIDGQDCVPVVRVKVRDIDSIKLALDCGAGGVVIPQVNTGEDACWAVKHSKYAPVGKRGIGPLRASSYGIKWNEYIRAANDNTLTIVQVEDIEAVKNLSKILSTPGIDGIYIGPGDLLQSIEMSSGERDLKLDEVIDSVIEAAKKSGLPVGMICATMDEVRTMVDKGVSLLTIGSDVDFMIGGAHSAVKRWREEF